MNKERKPIMVLDIVWSYMYMQKVLHTVMMFYENGYDTFVNQREMTLSVYEREGK